MPEEYRALLLEVAQLVQLQADANETLAQLLAETRELKESIRDATTSAVASTAEG